MTRENEKVSDIVAEMRSYAKRCREENFCVPPAIERHYHEDDVEDLADRIEAAHKREVAELRECLKETMVVAISEYHYNSCFKHVKCGEIERCKTCKVTKWIKALKGASND